MTGCVIAFDDEADALLSQAEITEKSVLYRRPVFLGKAFGK